MMKRFLIAFTSATLIVASPMGVHADDETPPTTTEVPTTTVSPTTTEAPSSSAPASTTPTTAAPTTTVASDPCRVDGYACGWAMLDENNNVVNVIVCTVEVCGGGTWDGRRVVLQTRQVEGGNVAGYNGGTYNDATNTFTVGGGYTLVGGSEVGDLIPPSTTSTLPVVEVTTTTIEETTTTVAGIVSSAVYGIERTTARVSTKTVVTKRAIAVKKKVTAKKTTANKVKK